MHIDFTHLVMITRASSMPIVTAKFAATCPKRTQPPQAQANFGLEPLADVLRAIFGDARGLRERLEPR